MLEVIKNNKTMWTELQIEIETVRKQLQIPDEEFVPLPYTTNWAKLEEKIYQAFCQLYHPTARPIWLWQRFNLETYSIGIQYGAYTFFDKLIEENEKVWLMLNESVNMGDKFWFYEGKIKAIQDIINESCFIDEFYLISKKYEWMLCVNHHDTLIATGEVMVKRLKELEKSIK